jgi:hypothetical protein
MIQAVTQQQVLTPPKGLPLRVTIILAGLCVGAVPLFLLNGQTFTNTLIALPFLLIAIVLCAAFHLDRRTRESQKRAWSLATLLLTLLASGIVLTLPGAYRSQAGFNKVREALHRARTKPHPATKLGQ